jgi:hypothetical protein
MERDAERGVDWVHLPVIATVARLPCRTVPRKPRRHARRNPGP